MRLIRDRVAAAEVSGYRLVVEILRVVGLSEEKPALGNQSRVLHDKNRAEQAGGD